MVTSKRSPAPPAAQRGPVTVAKQDVVRTLKRIAGPLEIGGEHVFTGSAAHNVRLRGRAPRAGLTLNEYGVFGRDVYATLGLDSIPPERREGRGEIEAAVRDPEPTAWRR